MKFREFEGVRLITDKYEKDGFMKGMIGTIVDIYNDGEAYEVDFTTLELNNPFLFSSFYEEDLSPWSETEGD